MVSSYAFLYHAELRTDACLGNPQAVWFDRVASPVDEGQVTSFFNTIDKSHDVPHNGVDIAAIGNTYAVVSGVVVANFYNDERGYTIAVAFKASNHRYYTYAYQHLATQSSFPIGSIVEIGQAIGQVGNSGRSFGTHLHVEVEFANIINGKPHWKGTYPTNPDVMFDFIDFFQLPKRFERPQKEYSQKQAKCRIILRGIDNEERTWNFLIEKGLTKEGAAGIIGNLLVESNLNPLSGERGGIGGGRGIAQWGQCGLASNGASAGCRWKTLETWANRKEIDPNALGTQLEYLIKEMTDYNILNYFKQTHILYFPTSGYGGGSVGYFAEQFERPSLADAHMERRYQGARNALLRFGSAE